jgi:chromosome segregation ATPase
MNRLESAKARFLTALDALESGVNARIEESRREAGAATEIELWEGEREQLLTRIAVLEEEARELAGLTEEVEGRLDGAIEELREALGRH